MTRESSNDAFERRYMGKFQEQAANYGVVVRYERDRGARDIGVHFFRRTKSGDEEGTGSLVWFQMKGLRTSTLSAMSFSQTRAVSIRVRVKDLQLWYRMNGPTLLAVYVESVDKFLVLNVVRYVEERFGTEIFGLGQKTLEVHVPTTSLLDGQAFALMLRNGTAEEWARVLGGATDVHLAQRDYGLIWRLSTAPQRGVEHRVAVRDWQTKLRGEIEFLEKPVTAANESWMPIREHWELMLRIAGLEQTYPYLSFTAFDDKRQGEMEFWSNEGDEPCFEFSDGTVVYGQDAAGEYYAYELRPALNALGKRLAGVVATLKSASMIELPEAGEADMLDVAPWHWRDV